MRRNVGSIHVGLSSDITSRIFYLRNAHETLPNIISHNVTYGIYIRRIYIIHAQQCDVGCPASGCAARKSYQKENAIVRALKAKEGAAVRRKFRCECVRLGNSSNRRARRNRKGYQLQIDFGLRPDRCVCVCERKLQKRMCVCVCVACQHSSSKFDGKNEHGKEITLSVRVSIARALV